MSKDLIVKDNKLIEANYSLSTLQQKVLLKAISIIEPTDTNKHIYKFSIMDFAEAVDLKGSKTIYSQMATICDQLTDLRKFFIKKDDGGIAYINWVASAEYIPKERPKCFGRSWCLRFDYTRLASLILAALPCRARR